MFNLILRHDAFSFDLRSEEHTSELQSRENLVCRLLLEKNNRPRKPAVLYDLALRLLVRATTCHVPKNAAEVWQSDGHPVPRATTGLVDHRFFKAGGDPQILPLSPPRALSN